MQAYSTPHRPSHRLSEFRPDACSGHPRPLTWSRGVGVRSRGVPMARPCAILLRRHPGARRRLSARAPRRADLRLGSHPCTGAYRRHRGDHVADPQGRRLPGAAEDRASPAAWDRRRRSCVVAAAGRTTERRRCIRRDRADHIRDRCAGGHQTGYRRIRHPTGAQPDGTRAAALAGAGPRLRVSAPWRDRRTGRPPNPRRHSWAEDPVPR